MDKTLAKYREQVEKEQARYKWDLDRRIKSANMIFVEEDLVYVEPMEGDVKKKIG